MKRTFMKRIVEENAIPRAGGSEENMLSMSDGCKKRLANNHVRVVEVERESQCKDPFWGPE